LIVLRSINESTKRQFDFRKIKERSKAKKIIEIKKKKNRDNFYLNIQIFLNDENNKRRISAVTPATPRTRARARRSIRTLTSK